MNQTAEVVICGCGITGVAAAYFLSRAGITDIAIVDERPPLSLTSDRSTECYRNWWPDAAMLALMNRSIDLMEALADESGNVFRMNRRGYLYVTGTESYIEDMEKNAQAISRLGAGPIRVHTSSSLYYQPPLPEEIYAGNLGADLLIGQDVIHRYFPYLTENAVAALHVRRAGWLSAQQLGMYLLEAARRRGVRFVSDRVTGVETTHGAVSRVRLASGECIDTPRFVNAAGPYLQAVGRMLDVELPVHTELHLKAAIRDSLGAVGRDAPLLIWNDPQRLPWEEEERQALEEDDETRWLTEWLPAGVHTRPEGGEGSQIILLLWEYRTKTMPPLWPPELDEQYPEVALRGLAAMLPRMREYFGKMPRPQLDGGYYTRTRENRPLVGPMGVEGAYVLGAVSGYGIMSACGVGELLSAYITGAPLPDYAKEFALSRYEDPEYRKKLESWVDQGQL